MAALALGLVLIGAVGLAIYSSQVHAHRQMAQSAADAAAQAAILSMYNGTNVGGNDFAASTTYTHTCSTTDAITPCAYARKNGFGGTASDTVLVDVPTAADVGLDPSVLSVDDPVALIRVTITRSTPMWFIPMLGAANTSSVKVTATAAMVGVNAPVPIAVLHPNLPQALSTNGNTRITICGGPSRGIQVNSSASNAADIGGVVDLSHAGPNDDGTCTGGTGADFGTFGGPATMPSGIMLGSTGSYVTPGSLVKDPFDIV
jgi:hypothetical protein